MLILPRPRLTLLTALALLTAGCAGSKVPPEAFMDDVCRAIVDWQKVLADAPQGEPGDKEAAQQAIADYLDSAAESTERLVEAVEDAGTPDMRNGKQIADGLGNGFGAIADNIKAAANDVEELSPAAGDFDARYNEITTALGKAVTEAGEAFGEIESRYDPRGELEKASGKAAACKEVAG